ncbi:MAG: aminopeptidase P N-terminal domain-containing protein [Acidimicrobiia bacterium]|nr:aminopeptidase P N-terminal domain-containing protein [Acidimicrobiia bacterium]
MTSDRFALRRADFLERLGDTIAIVPANVEQIRNDDVTHAFRQGSDFFFLTGFDEPDSIAVFDASHPTENYVLFVRPRDPEMESWNGLRAGTEGAVTDFGADAAFPLADFEPWLRRRLRGHTEVAFTLGARHADTIMRAMSSARSHSDRMGVVAPHRLVDPRAILHEMRLIKSEDEIEALRKASHISAVAHIEVMRFARPGLTERQAQAALEYVFGVMGAERVGYGSIVAGGDNAVILHYVENDQTLEDGDLLLIDAGAEYRHLTADITRTFPVNGTFTQPQRAVYDIVLAAERAIIDDCAPGLPYTAMHTKAIEMLTEGMVDIGLLPGPADEAVAKGWYREFFFHGTGHWLGIDVHDAGAYRLDGAGRPLEPGMAFTVEPGIYVSRDKATVTLSEAPYDADEASVLAFELGGAEAKAELARRRDEAGTRMWSVPDDFLGIGVRVEDDVLITPSGHENLTASAPTSPDGIEAVCAETSVLPFFD